MLQALSFLTGVAVTVAALPYALAGTERPATAFASGMSPLEDRHEGRLGANRDANGLFHVEGRVGDKSLRFLVDTGASHVVLSHADARMLGRQTILSDSTSVMTAGGLVKVDWILIDEIAIEGHVIRKLKAAIPRRDIGISLLGQNALAQFDTLLIDGDRLTFAHEAAR